MRLLDQGRWDRLRKTRLLGIIALTLLPAVLAILGYYRHKLEPSQPRWQLMNDSAFHLYQLSRGAELSGRWWKMADEGRVGRPYPLEVYKHPGIYEGVDVILLSAVSGRLLGPIANYHFMILAILCVNGWIAGWAVYRSTRSLFWSAIAMVLITLNVATAIRILGHLNLFKYGWTILAVVAFSKYLDRPTRRNGLLLGLASAWVFQGAFYSGCFIVLGLGVWWLGCLVAGRLRRDHFSSAIWAALAYVVLFVALMFPVFLTAKKQLLNDVYSMRPITDVWLYSSELWQYFISPTSRLAREYVASLSGHHRAQFHEGSNYMGLTVIVACGLYVVFKLRGKPLPISDPKLIDRMMGLIVLFVVLSLAGGPSFLIHEYFD